MPRDGRRYICLDLEFFEDAEDMGLTHRAERLFLRALIECRKRGTDGIVSRRTLLRLGGHGYHMSLKCLVDAGLMIEKEKDQYWIPSWHKWNEPMERVSARRAADRQRKRLKNNTPPHLFRVPD